MADGDEEVVWGEDGVGVAVFAGDVDAGGDAGVFFEIELGDESGMVARTASDDLDGAGIFELEFFDRFVEVDGDFVFEDASAQGVGNFLGLFFDFLEHVVGVALFFGGGDVPLNGFDGALDGEKLRIEDVDAVGRESGDVAVFEEGDLSGVCQDGGDVASGERFVFGFGEDERALASGGDDLVRGVGADDDERVGAAHEL